MSEIPVGKNHDFEGIREDLLREKLVDIEIASKVIDLFDKPINLDYHWPVEFLKNVLKNIHSEEPYKSKGLMIIQSDASLDLADDSNIPSISNEEYTAMVELSQNSYVVLYLRTIVISEEEFVLPCLYLPSLEHGFHVR